MIQRAVKPKILEFLNQKKVVIILGARRVGKTTLVKDISKEFERSKYINCELPQYANLLKNPTNAIIQSLVENTDLLVFDEAQYIPDIGRLLKIITDTYETKLLVTGSSAFYLTDTINKYLVGRSREIHLFPLSWNEILTRYDLPTAIDKLENILIYGLYPEVFDKSTDFSREEITNIANNYLYKDILAFEQLKHPQVLSELLTAIALQVGNEVSFSELSSYVGLSIHTVKRYIDLLEKNFVTYRLLPFSQNIRHSLKRKPKIYFYDNGIRNALINNFNPLKLRNDSGSLWENFCITERIKFNSYGRRNVKYYFWRSYDGKREVDLIEEENGQYRCFEFKFKAHRKINPPRALLEQLANCSWKVVTTENFYTELFSL